MTHKNAAAQMLLIIVLMMIMMKGVGERIRVRLHIIVNVRIKNVGKYQSCMVSKLRIIWKQTVRLKLKLKRLL